MSETDKLKPERSSGRRRIITWCRRLLFVGVLLFACNLVVRGIYQRSNEKAVREFYAAVGATSQSNLVGTDRTNELSENGWHLFMASLGCLSASTRDLVANVRLGDSTNEMPTLSRAVETELDEGHRLLERSRSKLRCVAEYRAEDHSHFTTLRDYAIAALLSAKNHRENGNDEKAKERLIDVFNLVRNAQGQPIMIGYVVGTAILGWLEAEIAVGIPNFSSGELLLYDQLFQEINLPRAFRLAMIGEVFYGIKALESINDFSTLGSVSYSLFTFEIDRSEYFDLIIPFALDPSSQAARARLSEPSSLPIFIAPMATSIAAILPAVLADHEAAMRSLDAVRKAIELETLQR